MTTRIFSGLADGTVAVVEVLAHAEILLVPFITI